MVEILLGEERLPGMMATLVCRSCHAEHSNSESIWRCPCGGLLDLEFEPEFPIKKIQERTRDLWRYREAIPIMSDDHIVSFGEGFTPLIPMEFADNDHQVLIKHDHLFLTGSFKDRGASVLLSKVKELGINRIVEDSSGNAGCAIAAYAKLAGIACDIYLSHGASPEKISQIEVSGGKLHRIEGGREAAARAALQAAEAEYFASHSWNPYFFHGTKTFAFEVSEQLGWKAPDAVVLPVGNGTLVLGASIGFNELREADIIDAIPRIIAVQAQRCNPLCRSFHGNGEDRDDHAICRESVGEGIAIPNPIREEQIIEAVKASKGTFLSVSEEEIVNSLRKVIEADFLIEPTSAATIAGVEQYIREDDSNPDEIIVSTFTGHGSNTAEKIDKLLYYS